MRLISCVALLMVIPAIGLLTKANKLTEKKVPEMAQHEAVVHDSTPFYWFNRSSVAANFESTPAISAPVYRLSSFKPVHPDSCPFFTVVK